MNALPRTRVLIATVVALAVSSYPVPSNADNIDRELLRQVPNVMKNLTIHYDGIDQSMEPDGEVGPNNWSVATFIRLIALVVNSTVNQTESTDNTCPLLFPSRSGGEVELKLDSYYGVDVDERLLDYVSRVA